MANYSVTIKRSAAKEIEGLQPKDRRKVVEKIRKLAVEPRPRGCEKLTGESKFRLRQGNLRILCEVSDRKLIVYVVKVGDRRDVYR